MFIKTFRYFYANQSEIIGMKSLNLTFLIHCIMKKIVLIIGLLVYGVGVHVYSQEEDIPDEDWFDMNWYFSKFVSEEDGTIYYYPDVGWGSMLSFEIFYDDDSSDTNSDRAFFYIDYCYFGTGELQIEENNTFISFGITSFAMDYCPSNSNYDHDWLITGKYFNFFDSYNYPYTYAISGEGEDRELIFTSSNGDQVYYQISSDMPTSTQWRTTFNNWYLSQINWEGEEYFIELDEEAPGNLEMQEMELSGGSRPFSLHLFYNQNGEGVVDFTSENSFELADLEIENDQSRLAADDIQDLFLNQFWRGDNFVNNPDYSANYEFELIEVDEGKYAMVITDEDGNEAIFGNIPNLSNEKHEQKHLWIYPNPTDGIVYFENLEKQSEVAIYDLSGKIQLQKHLNSSEMEVNLENLNAGIYLYRLTTENGEQFTGSIIKK